jgi:hypothetical protein
MSLEHATLTNLDTGLSFEVLFNPDQYTLSKDNNFASAAVPGLSSPLLQFVNGNARTLDLELFFDTLEEHRRGGRSLNQAQGDVRLLTQPVVDLLTINPATHAPPVALFAWGGLTFTGVLAKATQHFTMFTDTGVPVRARLQVTFTEWKSALQEAQEIRRQTNDYTRAYQVGQGETLSSIAAGLYGNPGMWRPIAVANRLLDPRRLRTGLQLAIPPLPYRNPATGEVYGG